MEDALTAITQGQKQPAQPFRPVPDTDRKQKSYFRQIIIAILFTALFTNITGIFLKSLLPQNLATSILIVWPIILFFVLLVITFYTRKQRHPLFLLLTPVVITGIIVGIIAGGLTVSASSQAISSIALSDRTPTITSVPAQSTDTHVPETIPTSTIHPEPSSTPPAPTVSASSDFFVHDDFNDNRNNWDTGVFPSDNGDGITRTITTDGFYSLNALYQANTATYLTVPITQSFGNFELSSNVRLSSGPSDTAYGFVFHHNSEGTYEFVIRNNSEYQVNRWDEKYSVPSKSILSKKTSLLKATGFNKITIRAKGDNVQFFINDALVDSITTDRYPEGQVGIIIEPRQRQPITIDLDDFEIRGLP